MKKYIDNWDKLTDEQKKQFVIKDNASYGDWDWDTLANEWDNKSLLDWGIDVWQPEEAVDYSVLDDLDIGDTLDNKAAGVKRAIQIEFDAEDYEEAYQLLKKAREDGKNVGLIVLKALRNDP